MITFTILIFFGQLIFSHCQDCNPVPPSRLSGLDNFDISRLTGTDPAKPKPWYVYRKFGSLEIPNFSDDLKGEIFYFRRISSSRNAPFEVVLRGKNLQNKCQRVFGHGYLTNSANPEGKITLNFTLDEEYLPNSQPRSSDNTFYILGPHDNNFLLLYGYENSKDIVLVLFPGKNKNIDTDSSMQNEINTNLSPRCIKFQQLTPVNFDSEPDCSPETETCDMDYLPYEKNMDFNNLRGKRYAVLQSGNIEQIYPKGTIYPILDFKMEQGQAQITFYGQSAGDCLLPREGKVDVLNAKNGHYFMQINYRKIELLVLQNQPLDVTLLYFCENKLANGSCDAQKTMQLFLSHLKSHFIQTNEFTDYVRENCLNPNNDQLRNDFDRGHDCSNDANIANKYMNVLSKRGLKDIEFYTDQHLGPNILNMEIDLNHCDIETFTVVDSLDIKKLSGLWYQVRERVSYGRQGQHHVTMEYEEKQYITITNRGRDKDNKCSTHNMNATFRNPDKKDGHLQLLIRNSSYWIMSTDYVKYTIVYSCAGKYLNGSCMPNKTSAWILSRKTSLSNETYNLIQTELVKICLDHDHFEDTKWTMDPCKDKAFGLQVSWWLYFTTMLVTISIYSNQVF